MYLNYVERLSDYLKRLWGFLHIHRSTIIIQCSGPKVCLFHMRLYVSVIKVFVNVSHTFSVDVLFEEVIPVPGGYYVEGPKPTHRLQTTHLLVPVPKPRQLGQFGSCTNIISFVSFVNVRKDSGSGTLKLYCFFFFVVFFVFWMGSPTTFDKEYKN